MIVDVEKYLIFGASHEINRFFSLAQRGGFLEFIGSAKKRSLDLPPMAKTFLAAIKIAKHYPTHLNEMPPAPIEIEKIAEEIVSMRAKQLSLAEEERVLLAEIARVAIFGNFSRSALNELELESNRVLQFFCMKSSLVQEVELPPEVLCIGTEYDLDYFVSIGRERTQYPKMSEILIERPLGVLKEDLVLLREEWAKLESDVRMFCNALPSLQAGLAVYLDDYHLEQAKHSVSMNLDQGLFAIEAWVPKTRVASLLGLISSLNVDCVPIKILPTDPIPTCLENKGSAKIGEDLLSIFDTPSHTDKDPSLWILIFFALFFSMIVSDAGYGFIFLGISLFLRWKFPDLRGVYKRLLRLSTILSVATILWGMVIASYFGFSIAPENALQKPSILSYLAAKKAEYVMREKGEAYQEILTEYPEISKATTGEELLHSSMKEEHHTVSYPIFEEFSNNVLMEFSFLVGIFHISFSFLRYVRRNLAGLGWVVFMIGGYLYFPLVIQATTIVNFMGYVSKATAGVVGLYMIFGGIALAFILACIQKGLQALHEIFHVVQVFADVLSYLRLYALALGSMVMAHTFNGALGTDPGLFATILIALFGHSVNVSLCLMGGVVHGLRLNFLEWFHYSFEGGGKLFNPLKLNQRI